jgi:hypothetical protein
MEESHMSDATWPFGDIGEYLKRFLKNRAEEMSAESTNLTDSQWGQAWKDAYSFRDQITSFSASDTNVSDEAKQLRALAVLLTHWPKGGEDALDLYRAAFEHVFAELFVLEVVSGMNSRVEWLASKVVSWKLSDTSNSLHYLRLVAKTYLFGLDQVCLVMCRGALEAWLEENVSDKDCKRVGKEPEYHGGKPSYRFAVRLEVAIDPRVKVLDPRHKRRAKDLYSIGSEAVHRGFKANRREVERCIDDLMSIINSTSSGTAK